MDIMKSGPLLLKLLVSAALTTMATATWAGSCDSPTAKALPLELNGVGEFCLATTGTISEFNSWNTQLVEINGVPFTNAFWNIWLPSLPDKTNGQYIIHYVSNDSGSHLEIKGTGGNNDSGSAGSGTSQSVPGNSGTTGGTGAGTGTGTGTGTTNNGSAGNGSPKSISVNLSAVGGDGKVDLSWAVTGYIRTIQVMRDTDADP